MFTGDTFYAGPIYLYRAETDLDAYVASLKKMVALSQSRGIQLLLPSHNVPVADPSVLPRVLEAIQKVRAGQIKSVPKDGNREYVFDGFSFLMAR